MPVAMATRPTIGSGITPSTHYDDIINTNMSHSPKDIMNENTKLENNVESIMTSQMNGNGDAEEEKTWQPGYVRNLVHFFGKLNRKPSIRGRGSAHSLNSRNGDATNSQRLAPIKSHDPNAQDTTQQNGVAPVHEPKTPSYIKVSCASGAKPYASPANKHKQTTVSLKQNGVAVTAAHNALDNNNIDINGQESIMGGEPVTLEYSPCSKNAYVKKVSERFERISNDSTNTPVQTGGYNNGQNATSRNGQVVTSQSGSTRHDGALESPVSQLPAVEDTPCHESNALVQSQNNDNVDSDNINFSQAKQAFVTQEKESSRGSSSHSTKRSADSKSDMLIPGDLPLENTYSSKVVFNPIVNNEVNGVDDDITPCDVTDNASASLLRQQNDVTIESISSDLPAEKQTTDFSNEHLSTSDINTHCSKDDTLSSAHMNGDIVNGIDDNLKVSRLSIASSGSLDALSSKDADYFLGAMQIEAERLRALCDRAEADLESANMSEEASGKVRAAIGKANLLTTKKFKQFKGLCERNMTQGSTEDFRTTCEDLAGFWDMVLIQVQDVCDGFNEINKLRLNDWKIASNKSSPLLSSKPSTPKTPKSRSARSATATPKSARAQEAAKAREDARRKLLEAKKAGRRQRKTSENNTVDDIEINIVT